MAKTLADLQTGDEVIIAYSDKRWKLTKVSKRTPKRIEVAPFVFGLDGCSLLRDGNQDRLKLPTSANLRKLRILEAEVEKKKAAARKAADLHQAEKNLKIEKLVDDIRRAKTHLDAVEILTENLWELQNL